MGSVLRYEIEDYQRALDRYNRAAQKYNDTVSTFNNSFVRDANDRALVFQPSTGNIYAVNEGTGQLTASSLPSGALSDYGFSAIPDESRFVSIRQGKPVSENRVTATAYEMTPYYDSEGGGYNWNPGANYLSSGQRNVFLGARETPNYGDTPYGAEWRVDGFTTKTVYDYEGSPITKNIYTISKDASNWQEQPGEFTKRQPRAPSFTLSDERKLQQGTNSQQLIAGERGIISDVIRSRGIK
jgi:hypothetical protein